MGVSVANLISVLPRSEVVPGLEVVFRSEVVPGLEVVFRSEVAKTSSVTGWRSDMRYSSLMTTPEGSYAHIDGSLGYRF